MNSSPHRWAKPMALLFTGGMIFGSSGSCVPEDFLFKLAASTRALVFDTFGAIVADGVNESINGTLFGVDALTDDS